LITVRRIYDRELPGEGYKVLVDRIWPRGVSREQVALDEWMKEVAPGADLRKWFGHDPARWDRFKEMYEKELLQRGELLKKLKSLEMEHGMLTLVYAASDTEHNNAVALKDFLSKMDY